MADETLIHDEDGSPESPTVEEFSAAIARGKAAGLSNLDMADTFKVSESTVDRWERGVSAPMQDIRGIVLKRLDTLLASRVTN